MDTLVAWGIPICSVLIVVFTVIQQQKQTDDQLRQKNEIISEFTNLTTGGDSYLFLRPAKVSNTDDVLLSIVFKGKYPLYDASVFIEEFDLKHITGEQYKFEKTGQRSLALGTVNPLQQNVLIETKVPQPVSATSQFGKRYFFKINSRNGMVEEDVVLRQEGANFSMAYKVVRYEPDYESKFGSPGFKNIKPKVRHIDPGFPVHQLDHLNGDSGWKASYEEQTGTGIN